MQTFISLASEVVTIFLIPTVMLYGFRLIQLDLQRRPDTIEPKMKGPAASAFAKADISIGEATTVEARKHAVEIQKRYTANVFSNPHPQQRRKLRATYQN